MRRLAVPLLGLSLLSAAPPAPTRSAAPPARRPAPRPEKWTVADVVDCAAAGDFQISPGGRFAAWVRSAPDKDKNEAVGQLMRTDLRTGREVQLTRGSDACLAPRWAPDGKHLAFLSARPAPKGKGDKNKEDEDDPKTQIWLLDPTGGEPWPLTELPRGVALYGWAGPGALVFAAQEEPTRAEARRKERKDTAVVVEDEPGEPPVRLFSVDVESKKVTRRTGHLDRVEQLAVAPDGKRAVAVHGRSLRYTYDNKVKPAAYLHDLAAGTRARVLADPKLNVTSVLWAPDGKGFYATNEFSSQPALAQAGVTELYYHDLAAGKATKIDLQWERGLTTQGENNNAPGVVPLRDGFLALLADGARHRAARYTRDGAGYARRWLTGEHAANLFGLQASADGKLVLYAHSTASTPTQWHAAALDGAALSKPRAVAALNGHLRQRLRAKTEVTRWKGANGDTVEGILYYPHEYQRGRKHPLVVMIHGGPAAADFDGWEESWAYAPNLLCQRGAFVLKPNYHGSANYGLKWLESIAGGKYGEPELIDVEKGVDALIERGLVDPARLGLYGWSNGAILTHLLTTRTTRYRAAVAGAGTVEYVSDWASCEFGEAFDRFYLGKSPLEDPKLYLRKSAFFALGKVRTPTLILHGAEDRVVATQQGWLQYRGLQQLGKAPVRFVLFPGEKHSLKKLSHQTRKLREELAWFDAHLFQTAKPGGRPLRTNSPLAWALRRQKAQRVGGRFGRLEGGALVPETVRHGPLTVGRFEVTRAQFAQFDKAFAVAPGAENLPASGVTYAQAAAYCAWLSKVTGKAYALPTEAEADELYGKPENGDNTLDRWAGYAVNPDDALRLREEAKKLPGPAPLLWEVGGGRGVGRGELVYDLGGNVAEWVTGKAGKGVPRGGSADTPADDRGGPVRAAPEYTGFRVVEGGAAGAK